MYVSNHRSTALLSHTEQDGGKGDTVGQLGRCRNTKAAFPRKKTLLHGLGNVFFCLKNTIRELKKLSAASVDSRRNWEGPNYNIVLWMVFPFLFPFVLFLCRLRISQPFLLPRKKGYCRIPFGGGRHTFPQAAIKWLRVLPQKK